VPWYRDCDESQAAHWWAEFDERRAVEPAPAPPAVGRTITITRDLTAPSEVEAGAAAAADR